MKKILFSITLSLSLLTSYGKDFTLSSPDGRLTSVISSGNDGMFYTLSADGKQIITRSEVAMTLNGGKIKCGPASDCKAKKSSVDSTVKAFAYKCSEFQDKFNSLKISSKLFAVEFRLYDEGLAYRFETDIDGEITVDSETAEFHTAGDFEGYLPLYGNLYSNFPDNNPQECLYMHNRLSEIADTVMMTPTLLDIGDGGRILITESDLRNYPGLNLQNSGGLKGVFAHHPSELYYKGGVRHVKSRDGFIARTDGKRTYPWRIIAYAEKDADLPGNNMVYALAHENVIGDCSWVKPGKSAWEWWANNTVYGVDFKVGLNTETYKYYIDFAKKCGLDYIIMDGGWCSEPLSPSPGVDIEAIVSYGKEKGVGVIVWVFANQLDDKREEICSRYCEIGISGFKVDFLDRDDQLAVEMVERIVKTAAKYHLIVDFHGIGKPAGLNRTYPNLLGHEGVFGLENYRWFTGDMITNELVIPFARMVAGPVDYTPGCLSNKTRDKYVPISNAAPNVMGTRAHQVAFYPVYDAPFGILADTPMNYIREEETTKFISRFPTSFDRTEVLQGEVGKFIVSARKKEDVWYLGGMNAWEARDTEVSLDFLDSGKTYKAEIYRDGLNADKFGEDYVLETREVKASDKLTLHMAPAGGFAVIFTAE